MSTSFGNHLKNLGEVVARFDAKSDASKLRTLQQVAHCRLPATKALINYCDLLLFLQAMPPNKNVLLAAQNEMGRVSRFLASSVRRSDPCLINSGLPFTTQVSKFSHDLITWLVDGQACRLEIDRFEDAAFDLNQILATTLPTLERSVTTSGYTNEELLHELGLRKGDEVPFLLNELKALNERPRVTDLLFDGLGMYLKILPKNRTFSRAYNVVPVVNPFFHDGILKEFDQRELLDRALPKASDHSSATKSQFIRAVKLALVLTDRETDPVTYMDERTFRVYELERGITIAIYGMVPSRQMPLESYIGFTLFKNGYPAAYGGAWVFGERADFGINIFEPFRGGESGYLMCQLLRVFRQVFNVEHFEIEPYQFGLDNPDGIATGAFWFYHKHGFRPIDKELLKLSEKEVVRRKKNKGHRTSSATLTRFTESNMALTMKKDQRTGVYDITNKVKRLIRATYKGNRTHAEAESAKKFLKRTGLRPVHGPDEIRVLQEVALWAEALRVTDARKLALLKRMVTIKPIDPYGYQELLLRFFKKV